MKIPNYKKGLRTYPQFNTMNLMDELEIGEYSVELMRKTSAYTHYFNKSYHPKKIIQRRINGKLIAIRVK